MKACDFKISTRIGAGFFALVLFTLAVGAMSILQLSRLAGNTQTLAQTNIPGLELTAQLRDHLNEIRRSEARHLLSSARKEMRALEAHMATTREQLAKLDKELSQHFTSAEATSALAAYAQHRKAWYEANAQMAPASRAGKQDEATTIYNGDSNQAFTAAMAQVAKLSELSTKEAAATSASAVQAFEEAFAATVASLVVAVALAGLMAVLIARSIARPIQEAVQAAEQIAEGNMSVTLEVVGRDETAQLLQSLETMRTKLASVVNAVRLSSDEFANASSDIARGNQDLSARTELQASTLQQTSASMEELGATVRRNFESAQRGNQLAMGASQTAVRGRDAVMQIVVTMKDISDSSRKIGDITTMIDAIAFQTNLLALNASVEAARAGAQGRGFAVVASEVRALSGRCALAAREIKDLINSSVEHVELGTGLVEEAGSTMSELVNSIRDAAACMNEISTSSRDQLDGVAQVGTAVTNIDQVTQQNAALVDSLTVAASRLESQATELVKTVSVFKLESVGPDCASDAEELTDQPLALAA